MNLTYDLVALGGGTGGLVSAAGAAYLGLSSAIVEKTALGGDCLWTGCVPSKALIASARMAHSASHASDLGLADVNGKPDFAAVMDRMKSARDIVAHHDDPERFRSMGVDVHLGAGRFTSPSTLEVDGIGTIRSKRFVIATGATAFVPPIPGLEASGYWTYETVFDQRHLPDRVTVLGGGPIGLEFAQVFSRLGAEVTVVEMAERILIKEDPDVSAFMMDRLEAEGIRCLISTRVDGIGQDEQGQHAITQAGERISGDQLFVATGRRPNTAGLGLEAAGVELDRSAVRVDPYLQTTAKGIWAVGDVTGGLQFTHVAEHMAKGALQNAVLPFKRRIKYDNVPWVTFTDPEVAHIGLSETEASARGATTFRYDLEDLDRAIVDGSNVGFVKVSADRKGRILGATVVAHGAGELIQPLVLAKQNGLTLSKVAGTIFPYPTMVEGVKRTSNEFMRGRLETPSGRALKKVIGWLK